MKKWILYNLSLGFAVYWASNLLLWYPWSVNETLGQILMLTICPIMWIYASYRCIINYPRNNNLNGALLNGLFFAGEAILSDLLFFGVIRGVMDKLLLPTTLFAWGWGLILPLIIYFLFKKKIAKNKRKLTNVDFRVPLSIGLLCLIVIVIILLLNIQF
jgi:hypothetical protein